jgi:hypothetical protein
MRIGKRLPKWSVLPWLVGAGLTVWLFMRLSALEPHPGLAHLQLAGSHDRAVLVTRQWTTEELENVRRAIRLDYAFIPAYGVAISGLCLWGGRQLRFPTLRRIGLTLAWGTGLAVVLDLIENVALSEALDDPSSSFWPLLSASVAWPKFFILAPALAFGLVTSGNRVWRTVQVYLRQWSRGPQKLIRKQGEHLATALQRDPSRTGGGGLPNRLARRTFGIAHRPLRAILGLSPPAILSQSLPMPEPEDFERSEWAPPALQAQWRPVRGKIGICCSGGGIRSAAYNLGALQALQKDGNEGVLQKATYLSAVSGGAYIAAAYALVDTDTAPRARETFGSQPAFAPGSPESEYLRNRSSYLAPKVRGKVRLVLRLLTGLSVNVAFVWAVLFVSSGALGWLLSQEFLHPELRDRRFDLEAHLWWAAGWPALAGYAAALLAVLRRFKKYARYRRAVYAAKWLLILSGLLLAILIVLPLLAWAIPVAVRAFLKWLPGRQTETVGGTRNFIWLLEILGVGSLGAALLRLLSKHTSRIALFALVLVVPILTAVTLILLTGDAAAGEITLFGRSVASQSWWLIAGAALGLGVFYGVSDQTTWSMHPFYKRRLCTAFALRRCVAPEAPPYAKASDYDDLEELSRYRPDWYRPPCLGDQTHQCRPPNPHTCTAKGCQHGCDPGPELIVCAAVNISDEGTAPPGRDSVSFTFTSSWIGGPEVGWIETAEMENALADRRREDITLPAAVAISGAALSPAMGKMSPPIAASLLALLNARLGVWLPNPRWVQRCREEEEKVTWRERPRVLYLLKEIFGRYSLEDPFLYVTDGGHWENLGLVELLRRGCTEIYCFDASGDDIDTFFTLGEAVALARTTLGVEIDIDPEPLEPKKKAEEVDKKQEKPEQDQKGRGENPRTPRSPADHVVGTFTYQDGTKGRMVFAKAAVTDQSSWDVKAYAEKDAAFPTHGTVDQLFTDEKFEAYRALGWGTASRAVKTMKRAKLSGSHRFLLDLADRSRSTYRKWLVQP